MLGVALGDTRGCHDSQGHRPALVDVQKSAISRIGFTSDFFPGNALRCAGVIAASLPLVYWGLRPDYRYLFGSATCAAILYAIGTWLAVFDKNDREVFRAVLRKRLRKQERPPVEATIESVPV